MKTTALLLLATLLSAPHAAGQTYGAAPDTPQSSTTVVVPGDNAPGVTSTTSQTGTPNTTVTNVRREDGSTTTIITQQPQSAYQPMGSGGYHPMGR